MSTRPAVHPSNAWTFPAHEEWTLANGLRVWAFELPGQHVVSAMLTLDIPLDLEPRDQEGVAHVALHASDEGTADHPGDELSALLESHGAAFDGSLGLEATVCGIDVPATRLRPAMELFAEIVARPAYHADDVARHVALRLAELEQAAAHPGSLAQTHFRRALYDASSRSARPSGGEADTVATLTPEQVADFHARRWTMSGATLVLAGQLPADHRAVIEDAFGGLTSGDGVGQHPAPVGTPDAERVILVNRPDAVQAEIRIGRLSIDRTDPLWTPARLGVAVMGGSFGSRLNLELRERLGYTYGASLSLSPRRSGGLLTMAASVRTEVAGDATRQALRLLRGEPFTDDEVDDARSFLIGGAPLRYDTSGAIADQASTLAASGIEPDFVDAYYRELRDVTTAQATDAYRELVADRPLATVIVGDAEALAPQLADFDFAVVDA